MNPKKNPLSNGWLAALVAEDVDRHDPAAALARIPPDVRGAVSSETDLAPAAALLVARSLRLRRLPADATETFVGEVRQHVALLLDLAVLRGARFDRTRRRVEIAAFLAAALGEVHAALEALPIVPLPRNERDTRDLDEALSAAEAALAARFNPPGDPVHGLLLHPGLVAVLRRRLARVAMGFYREGRLEPEAIARHAAFAERETVLLVEALAGLAAASGAVGERARAARQRQIARIGLSRAGARGARAALASPRAPELVAAAAQPRVRPFLVEQLFLAQLRAAPAEGGEATRYVDAFVAASGLDATAVASARVEAAAQHGDHQVWFEALDDAALIDWQALAGEWEAATDAMVERVSSAVTDNLDAILTEVRQTGELGQLLARAASGTKLSADERRKVRSQLIDLAKAVPALAIFAAPGGMLLLPLLAKLLPFNLLPSAWDRPAAKDGAAAGVAAKPAAKAPKKPKPDRVR